MNENQDTQQHTLLTLAYQTYKKDLKAHAFFKVHDHTLSEDLVQDAFIKTWHYLRTKGKIDTMKAFLYHVLNDLIIDEYRKKKPVSLDNLLENGFEPSHTTSDTLVNVLDGETAFHVAQKRLPAKYQKVIRMRYAQDLSLAEMSLITGQSKNTMAVQVHRALEKLRSVYNPVGLNYKT